KTGGPGLPRTCRKSGDTSGTCRPWLPPVGVLGEPGALSWRPEGNSPVANARGSPSTEQLFHWTTSHSRPKLALTHGPASNNALWPPAGVFSHGFGPR